MPPANTIIVNVENSLITNLARRVQMGLGTHRGWAFRAAPQSRRPEEDINRVNPLGENLIVLLVLALGGALAVGNILALVNPRDDTGDDELERPPLGRTLIQIAVGAGSGGLGPDQPVRLTGDVTRPWPCWRIG